MSLAEIGMGLFDNDPGIFEPEGGSFNNSGDLRVDRGDAKIAAEECSEFTLTTITGDGQVGAPSTYTVQIILIDPTCGATPDFQVRGMLVSGGPNTDLGDSMSEAGTDSQDFAYSHPIIDVLISDDASCDAPGNNCGRRHSSESCNFLRYPQCFPAPSDHSPLWSPL